MKIIHILSPAHAGGLERVVQALAIGQQRSGHQVIVLPVTDAWTPDHSLATPLVRASVEIVPLVVPNRAYRQERKQLRQAFANIAPHILHSHGYHTDVIAGGVARRQGIATVSTAHGFTRGPWRNRLYEYIDRRALRHFGAVAAVSQPLADELRKAGVPAEHIHLVPNAWTAIAAPLDRAAARLQLGLDPHAFTFGWVGRMTHEKGLDVLVDALAQLTDVPVQVCVMGAGPEREGQEGRAAALAVAGRMHWAGLVREAGRYFQAFDGLVLSSRTEGVPMVMLEAMAAHVPLVVTAVGGIPAVVSEREAILVPPEQPIALATGMRAVFANHSAASARAAAARARLDSEFAEGPWLKKYDYVYNAALEQRPR